MIRKRIIGATSVSTLLLLGSGCGKITEKRTEKVIEDQTGGKADFDLDSGKVKVSDGKDGTYEVDENGNVKISDGRATPSGLGRLRQPGGVRRYRQRGRQLHGPERRDHRQHLHHPGLVATRRVIS